MARERKCRDCGTTKDLNSRGTSCFSCSGKRMHDGIMSMVNKSGPAYEKWLAAMRARFVYGV